MATTGEPGPPPLYIPGPANPSMYTIRPFVCPRMGSHASRCLRRISCLRSVWGSKSQTVPLVSGISPLLRSLWNCITQGPPELFLPNHGSHVLLGRTRALRGFEAGAMDRIGEDV